jgi:hypothetical protein
LSLAWAKNSQNPIFKITRIKWTRGVAQAVEGLLFKYEALSSITSPAPPPKKSPKFENKQNDYLSNRAFIKLLCP